MSAPSSIIPAAESAAESPSLLIELRPRPVLRWPLLGIYLLAAASLIITPLPAEVIALSLCLLIRHGLHEMRHLPAASAQAVTALQWHIQQQRWQLRIAGQWQIAQLIDVVIWVDWIFLRFKFAGQRLPVNLPLSRQHMLHGADWAALRSCLYD